MFSVHEPTWSKENKCHTCCGSTHSYHRTNCKIRNKYTPPGRSSDPNYVNIQELKAEGFNTGEISRKLNLPLLQVNDLFIS